jgi:phosphoribosylformimino-5-aminoimidazole carboxamide ribotide isomerase
MIIYPAVDIKDGKCVRLVQGKFSDETVYSKSPVEMGLKWEKSGAEYLHVVDLDGARTGEPKNLETIGELAEKLNIPVQLGGGIRNIEIMEKILSKGLNRVILGTSAVRDLEFVKNAIKMFRDKIVIGIDAKDGMVAIEGWAKTSEFSAIGFAQKMQDIGVKTIIYTDISRDGMLVGPNLTAMDEMVKAVDLEVIASGGVSKLGDVRSLKDIGVAGAIIGKALYTGDIDLKLAMEIAYS